MAGMPEPNYVSCMDEALGLMFRRELHPIDGCGSRLEARLTRGELIIEARAAKLDGQSRVANPDSQTQLRTFVLPLQEVKTKHGARSERLVP